jgi:hypothetical protein
MTDFVAGQRWTYRPPDGFQASRMVIGAIITFEGHERIICAMVTGAPQLAPDRTIRTVTIPFLPLSETAFAASVVERDGTAPVSEHFRKGYADWKVDQRGLSYFKVPFEGYLDRLIRRQLAEIIDA